MNDKIKKALKKVERELLAMPTEQFLALLDGSSCSAWLSEGRALPHEWLTEDGIAYECAHCGLKRQESGAV